MGLSINSRGDEIRAFGLFGVDFTDEEFVGALDQMAGEDFSLRLQSNGGDVMTGQSMFNSLRDYPGHVSLTVDAISASIASVFMMAADEIALNDNSVVMVHDPWAAAIGNAREFRALADVLEMLGDKIADIYAARTGTAKADWLRIMAGESYFNASEALSLGLGDRIIERPQQQQRAAAAATPRPRAVAVLAATPRRDSLAARLRTMRIRADLTNPAR